MTQKLTFVNGAKAACGCRHEFSSGGGEYSDVASVHLCAMHAGSPVLDDRWKARMLDGRAPERDEMGFGNHPELPSLDEGMMPRSFFAALGLELTHTSAEEQLDGDVLGAMSEAVNWTDWQPTAPQGKGWKLVSIFDTEDGPVAWWLRELPEAEDGTTTIRNLQAEVEKLEARIARLSRAGAAPAAVAPQGEYPPLPEGVMFIEQIGGDVIARPTEYAYFKNARGVVHGAQLFTADQLRAYFDLGRQPATVEVPAIDLAEVELPDVEDMAHSAVQEALSFGVHHDVFHRWMRAVMDKTVEAMTAEPVAAPALEAPAAPATPVQIQALRRARSVLCAIGKTYIGKTYDDSELRTRALEADEEIERMLAAAPQAPAAPSPVAGDWDGKLPEQLQRALNALRLECPPAVVADVEHEVRSCYEALHTSLATTRRMYGAARDRLEALDAAQPDPFAPAQAAPAAPVALPGPAAWTLQSELDAKCTTTRGHLWFADPVNCLWTALYTEQQVRTLLAAAPAAPAVDAETIEDAERFRAMAKAALTDDEVFERALDQHPDMGGDATIDDVRAMFDAAIAAQAKEGGAQ